MFQTCSNSQLLRRVLWISAEQTIGASLKHKNTQPLYIFNRENPQNSEPQNDPRSGLDYIALKITYQTFGNSLCQQCFATASRAKHHDIGFFQFQVVTIRLFHV